jgi:hypothetical protein
MSFGCIRDLSVASRFSRDGPKWIASGPVTIRCRVLEFVTRSLASVVSVLHQRIHKNIHASTGNRAQAILAGQVRSMQP